MTRFLILSLLIVLSSPVPVNSFTEREEISMKERFFIDFTQKDKKSNWEIVNDVVMGGLSSSEFLFTEKGTAIFKGIVSLDNNGGFASVRSFSHKYNLSDFDGILLIVKGDGKRYSFRIRIDDSYDGISYQMPFETKKDDWIRIKIPFQQLRATYRGQEVPNAPPMDPAKIRRIGLLISEKQEGPFRLEIERIGAYAKGDSGN